jgi:hypothetical protein
LEEKTMSFPAKFGGTCSKCAGRIAAGASVNYDGKSIRHAPRCPAKGSVVEVEAPAPRKYDDTVKDDTRIVGRAAYKGKSGYLILWMGVTKKSAHPGDLAYKLAFRDGTKVFWGASAEVRVEKIYDTEHTYRGHTSYDAMTFGRLNELAKKYKETPPEDRGKCESCGRWNGNHAEDCDMANGGMSYRNAHGVFVLGADD